MDAFQIGILSVGGGVLVTFGTLLYRTGRRDEHIAARLRAIEKHFEEHGMVAMLWRFYEDGTLHNLKHTRGSLKENSPLSFTAALEQVSKTRGVKRSDFEKFLNVIPISPAPADPFNPTEEERRNMISFIVEHFGWDDGVKDGAARHEWTRAEWLFQYATALLEAHRDGPDVVIAKILPYVVEG